MRVHFISLVAVKRLLQVSLGGLSGFCFFGWPVKLGMESLQLLSSYSQAPTALKLPFALLARSGQSRAVGQAGLPSLKQGARRRDPAHV